MGLENAIPQKHSVFAEFCSEEWFFLRFFDQFTSVAGIYCVVIVVGTCLAVQPSGKPPMMIIHSAKPLFAWDCLEDNPSLQTIKDLLAALPDGKLLNSLRAARGKGRNDYSVSTLWGVVVLRVALRHITTEAVLAELRRNVGLRRLIGIESEAGVPKPWNITRFEDVLGQEPHRTLLKEVFDELIKRLGVAVADVGINTAGDATGLSAAQAGGGLRKRRSTRDCLKPAAAARNTRTTKVR